MVNVLPKTLRLAQQNKLENITLRGFGGGWNTVDSDISMDARFLVSVKNFRRTASGSQRVRFGSNWFADLSNLDPTTRIIDMWYFSDRIIVVTARGRVYTVDSTGAKVEIWNPSVAAALPGAPSGWSTAIDTVTFVPYKNELIIHNGIDKPITISVDFVVTYLQDLATGSNVNVPVGRYGCVVSNYHCVAGIDATPTTVFISSVGTAGTFPGDPAPNDSISVDIGAYAPQGAIDIRGIAGFRQNLIVFFLDQAVIMRLGQYDVAGVHIPAFPDTMPNFGLLSHRCVTAVENDLLFAGLNGVASARRNILSVTGTLESTMLSEYIETAYREATGVLTDLELGQQCFSVYDTLGHDLLLFTPSRIFVYSYSERLRYRSWSEYTNLNVTSAVRSFLGRVFYADGLRIYQHGNGVFPDERYENDRMNDRDSDWVPGTFYSAGDLIRDTVTNETYEALINHLSAATGSFAADRIAKPGYWELYEGIPIAFELELPWLDSKDPMKVKQLRFISAATKGTAQFTIKAYVDNLYKDDAGNILYSPALQMDFIGNDAPGEGYDAGPYGGGRHSNDPRLTAFPVKFKTIKIVLSGNKGRNIELVTMSFLFSRGRYKR